MATGFGNFNSTMLGAPSLTNAAGSAVGVLDWVLDTANANGRKVASVAYTGTNRRDYRFDGTPGIRHYFDWDDTATNTTPIRAYEAMSALGTGTDPYPTVAQATTGFQMNKSQSGTARRWDANVTNRFAIVMADWNGDGFSTPVIMGEIPPYDPLDTYCSVLIGPRSNNTGTTSNFTNASMWATMVPVNPNAGTALGATWPHVAFARNINGTVKANRGMIIQGSPIAPASGSFSGINSSMRDDLVLTGAAVLFPLYLVDCNQTSMATLASALNNTTSYIRARIPYLFGVSVAPGGGINHLDTRVINGQTYRFHRCTNTTVDGFIAMMITDGETGLP